MILTSIIVTFSMTKSMSNHGSFKLWFNKV